MSGLDSDFEQILANMKTIANQANGKTNAYQAGDFSVFNPPAENAQAADDLFTNMTGYEVTGSDGWDIDAVFNQQSEDVDLLNTADIGFGGGMGTAAAYGNSSYNQSQGLTPQNLKHMVIMTGNYIKIGMMVEDAALFAVRHFCNDFEMNPDAQTQMMATNLSDKYRQATNQMY